MSDEQERETIFGREIPFEVDGEKRSVAAGRYEDGSFILVFSRGDTKTTVRLSNEGARHLATVLHLVQLDREYPEFA